VDAFLKREVEKFRDGAEINDDMTLLCMLIE
jgi:serine phosphatase RsbU (regulator of sigma subunit)